MTQEIVPPNTEIAPEAPPQERTEERAAIKVIDRRRTTEVEDPSAHVVPRKVKDFFAPPPRIHGIIIPVSGEASFDPAVGFRAPCSKGWAKQAAKRFKSFPGALGYFTSQLGAVAHVITFDATSDKKQDHGYDTQPPAPPRISMQGDGKRILSYHVLTLPVRGLDESDLDPELIARSMRRLTSVLLDRVPSLVPPALLPSGAPSGGAAQNVARFWLPVIRDKKTPWESIRSSVEPYLDTRIEVVEVGEGEANT